jgi:hypothetical protein
MVSLAQSSLAQLGLRTVKSAAAYAIDQCRREYECSHTAAPCRANATTFAAFGSHHCAQASIIADAAAVCGLGFVAYRMRKSAFAKLRRERADFRSSIRKRRSEPVRGYRPSPAHALQQHEHRHIGQWSAGLLTEKTNSEIRALASSLTMARAPLGKLHAMLAPRLHARRRDGPVPRIEIEFPPFGI